MLRLLSNRRSGVLCWNKFQVQGFALLVQVPEAPGGLTCAPRISQSVRARGAGHSQPQLKCQGNVGQRNGDALFYVSIPLTLIPLTVGREFLQHENDAAGQRRLG